MLSLGLGLEETPVVGIRGRRLRLEKLLVVKVGRRRLSQGGGGLVGVLHSLSKRNESDESHVLNSKNIIIIYELLAYKRKC